MASQRTPWLERPERTEPAEQAVRPSPPTPAPAWARGPRADAHEFGNRPQRRPALSDSWAGLRPPVSPVSLVSPVSSVSPVSPDARDGGLTDARPIDGPPEREVEGSAWTPRSERSRWTTSVAAPPHAPAIRRAQPDPTAGSDRLGRATAATVRDKAVVQAPVNAGRNARSGSATRPAPARSRSRRSVTRRRTAAVRVGFAIGGAVAGVLAAAVAPPTQGSMSPAPASSAPQPSWPSPTAAP